MRTEYRITAFHSLLPDSWGTGKLHPKQGMRIPENPPKVKENRDIGAIRGLRSALRAALAAGAIALGIVTCAAGGPAGSASAAGGGAAGRVDSLVILHTNDVHSHLDPFEVRGGATVGGAAARASLIARERARGGRVLLLDAGDLVQGTPYYNAFHGEPDHRILDLLGYDAIALGNHDLDEGADAWRERAAKTKTPILSANVFVKVPDPMPPSSAGGASMVGPIVEAAVQRGAKWIGGGSVPEPSDLLYLARPYVILERDGLKIAILGLTTYSLDTIVSPGKNQGVAVGDPVAAARYFVPRLRRQADIVIALTHLGVEDDRRLVAQVPGIDLVVGGHSHTPLFRPVLASAPAGRVTPIAQAGSWGRWLGRTTLRWGGDHLTSASGRLIEVSPSDGEDPEVKRVVDSYRSRLGPELERAVYRSPARVEMTGLDDPDHPLGNFVADVMRDATGADVAIMNAGGIRAPLPAGEVRERDILSMLPFENQIVVVSLSGSELRALLDRLAARLGKGGFGHVAGLSYVVQGGRANDVRLWARSDSTAGAWRGRSAGAGVPLDGNRIYRVATIDFLTVGGDSFDELRDAATKEPTGTNLPEAADAFLRAHPDYRFAKDGRVQWRGSGESLRGLRSR
jgi:5'-nucleotidase/UDP-sugar diphosphatase